MHVPECPVAVIGWTSGAKREMREEVLTDERGVDADGLGGLYGPFPKSAELIGGRCSEPEHSGVFLQGVWLLVSDEPESAVDLVGAAETIDADLAELR
jgi:hypothetical protein